MSLPMILLLLLLICLAVGGGASRGDALGQSVVRFVAAAVLATLIAVRVRVFRDVPRLPLALLGAVVALPLLQLLPLPPSIWSQLPAREAFLEAAAISGLPQPWRPISLSPDATWNALFSLLVPTATVMLAGALTQIERVRMPGVIFALAAASAMLAVVQVAGARLDNPLINETVGSASGFFANPNHQALLLAIGIVAGAAWAQERQSDAPMRVPIAAGAAIFFLLMIMASGSRAGLALGFFALGAAALTAKSATLSLLMRVPVRMRLMIVTASLGAVIALAVISFNAGRAVSLNRLLALSTGEDLRSRALPTVWEMIPIYLPFGTGFGSFDPLFRMHEPDALLSFSYFNHAHCDYLEIALESGIFGLALLAVAMAWALWRGAAAWRADRSVISMPAARFGATAVILVAFASLVDYPARTPIIMAVLAVSAVLVARSDEAAGHNSLRLEASRV